MRRPWKRHSQPLEKEPAMELNTYLTFNGQCEAAFKFYERALGGKIVAMLTHAGTPAARHVSKDWQDKIMHARLQFGDRLLMASDAPPDRIETKGFHVQIGVNDPTEADRIFGALAANGKVTMPIEETF